MFGKDPSLAARPPEAWRLLLVALLAASALLPLLPLLAKYVPASAGIGRAFGFWFDLHCQRDPARTLRLLGVPLAVCARCSGIYFGLGAGAALRRPRLTPGALRSWVLAAAALMVLDVVLEAYGVHGPWAAGRLLTGLLLAYPVGAGLGAAALGARAERPAQSP